MQNQQKHFGVLEKIAIKLTEMAGTPVSLIVHSFLFVGIFGLRYVGFSVDSILLILTTAVSLEAIYLAIFIQMTVNRSAEHIETVTENVMDIHEDVQELEGDVDKLEENVDEIEDDIKEISEDVDEIQAEEEKEEQKTTFATAKAFSLIEKQLQKVIEELEILKKKER
ncbi:MAG: DUF1003 domain-containing protein [Candidatus Spechtbacteria bacterium]|nr:DUF1003 domain-containing protein [Candidatus Spechtbacteria bacterium]